MTSAQAMLLEEPLPRGRRWRERRQRDQRWRNSALLAFVLALLAHLLLLRLWWVDSPLPGLTLPRMPAISVRLFDPPAPTPIEAPSLPTQTPSTTQVVRRPRPAAPTPLVTVPEPPVSAAEPPVNPEIDWPAAIRDYGATPSPAPGARSPLEPAPLPALPGADGRAWSGPRLTPADRLRQVGGAMSSAPVTGGGLLNKLVAPSHFEHMVDSDLVDKQLECHPTADGFLYCPQKVRASVPGSRGD
ncbi:MAG: hypothetical protein R3F15_15265 [Lysobacterales bacterium]